MKPVIMISLLVACDEGVDAIEHSRVSLPHTRSGPNPAPAPVDRAPRP